MHHWANIRLLMVHVVDLNLQNDNFVHFTIIFRMVSKLKFWLCIVEIHKSKRIETTNVLDPHSTIQPVCNNFYQKLVQSPTSFDSYIHWKLINEWPIFDYLNANQMCRVSVFHTSIQVSERVITRQTSGLLSNQHSGIFQNCTQRYIYSLWYWK